MTYLVIPIYYLGYFFYLLLNNFIRVSFLAIVVHQTGINGKNIYNLTLKSIFGKGLFCLFK